MPKFNEFLLGTKDKIKKAKTLDSGQEELMALIKEGLEKGEGPLADIFGSFDEQAFQKGVADPAIKNFQDNILPLLQEKFIAGNQVGGSGMANEFSKAGVTLQSELAKLMYQGKQDQKKNRLEGLQTSLGTKTHDNIYKQGSEGLVQGAAKGFAQGAGNAVGGAIAG